MAKNTEYREEINKLKQKRYPYRLMAGISGFLTTGVGAALIYKLTTAPPSLQGGIGYFLLDIGYLASGGFFGLLSAKFTAYNIVESSKISKKIRKLERELTN